MADDSGEKTEEPSDKKLQDSRKKGQVWKSRDLTGVVVFLVGMGAVKASWENTQGELSKLFSYAFENVAHPQQLNQASFGILFLGAKDLLVLTLPVLGGAALLGALVDFLQVGALFTPEPLIPKLEKLNPIQGFKNIFSKKTFIELIKSTLKITIAGYVVYGAVKGSLKLISVLEQSSPDKILIVLGELVSRVSIRVSLLFALFAIFDVWLQRRSYMKDLMMSKDEVKKEYKESEGDPHHKAARKQMHHEILEGAMMESVKGADVVVTNPDHVAVVLAYDRARDRAPRILLTGTDERAEAIKAAARAAGVPLLRNVPLARALLASHGNSEIPESLYDAVAETLNFVYGMREAS